MDRLHFDTILYLSNYACIDCFTSTSCPISVIVYSDDLFHVPFNVPSVKGYYELTLI